MHEHDADVVGRDVRVVAAGRADEVVQLGGRLHAGEAATRHHEGEQGSTRHRIGVEISVLEFPDHEVVKTRAVGQALHGPRPLGHAR